LDKFAAHRVPLEIHFADEKGVGSGVRREFVAKLSEKFREREDLWRRNRELGLFPAPTADPDAFRQMGILAAKALTMDCLVGLPFNPAFFAVVAGEDVPLSEVDPVLDRTIRFDPTGCEIEFEYPGYPEAFARPGEIVTEQNQEEFVHAVEEASVKKNVQECAKRFREGFESVMCYRSMDLFSNDEISRLIAGAPAKFERDEFARGIELSDYEAHSPAIVALADVLEGLSDAEFEAFVKFVTGSKQLPAGGFAGLRPRMGVWRLARDGTRADESFPMATVCLNALRLPPYSSAEKLKEKLLVAINRGGDTFFLP
jgi:E3 ubiquitin-protein ligase TRIP12